MKEQIEDYSPPTPRIVALGPRRVRAYIGDEPARVGSTLWVGDIPTRVVAIAGNHRVEATAFDTSGFAVGDAVRWSDQEAAWPAPVAGVSTLESLQFAPDRAVPANPAPRPIDALPTGIAAIDTLLPLARHGVTLVLDPGAPDRCVDLLVGAAPAPVVCASARVVPHATHQLRSDEALALAVAAQWAQELGATLLLEAGPFDVDVLLSGATAVTAIVRAHLRDGLDVLAESLDLGHSDTQIVLRADGTVDLGRSASDLTPDPALATRFGRLAALREHITIFGDNDLEPDDAALLGEAETLEQCLL